jgi:23S rRNA (uracil1939-C5)-methyltransferase
MHGVFGALPGELVTSIPITRRNKKLFGRATTITNPAAARVEARCSAAGYCGGCSLQHMSAESQLLFKQERLSVKFEDCPPIEWLPPVCDDIYNYRSKARLGAKFVEKKGRVLVGFREKMKPYIADIEVCHVLQHPIATLIQPLERLITSLDDPRIIPQIEVAIGDTSSALVFRHLEALQSNELDLFKTFGRDFDVDIYLQPGNAQSVYKLFPKDGVERLDYQLPKHDCRISFHPLDFTQVNPRVNRKMVDLALDLLEVNESDQVLDAFCGIGNFSLPLARKVNRVLGLENAHLSVERARENAIQNGIKNTRFEVVDLFMEENLLPDLGSINKVLVDPPRTGALELCKKLAKSKVKKVVYVSCNPRTLARDAQILVENGYQLRQLGIIDMFPHTTHVESIALLTR